MLSHVGGSRVSADGFSRNLRLAGVDMAEKHIVVTGAGTGIGRAIARRLSGDGAAVTVMGLDAGELEETAASLDRPSHVAPCDVRKRRDVDDAVAQAAATLGPISALVAGSGIGGENEDGAGDRFDDLVQTNLAGTYYTCRAVYRHLAPGPEPRHIVVISSILARIGVAGYTGYSASKAGLLGLVRSLAAELAPAGVQVNAICPGWVDTNMAWEGLDAIAASTGGTREDAYRTAMEAVPLGRMARPEEVAGTVAWLVSADARGVTGQAIDHNGGAWMG
jgi:NAD(P)-dependent dehydrogenase (short-subunit alcohol dehydrogenase family)